MLVFLYNFSIATYHLGIRVASLWNAKARKWLNGREKLFSTIAAGISKDDRPVIWFHCSSLGEFEQGRPLLESIKKKYPGYKIVLTFFSPSGFEVRKNYDQADHVFYLPLDTAKNSKRFIDLVKPTLAIFVKYEYWYHLLHECKKRNVPVLMVSAIFRSNQPFFRSYGTLHRRMLRWIDHFFVQDERSASLLSEIGITHVSVSGDTRFDRVAEIAANEFSIPAIEIFCGDGLVLVAGSTWISDEEVLRNLLKQVPTIKLVIAPHEINNDTLQRLKRTFPDAVLLPDANISSEKKTLIIDRVGILAAIYRYGTFTYVGGGFDHGIHNVLEAAAYGRPVFFGPKHEKFIEAKGLINYGGGFAVQNAEELIRLINKMIADKNFYSECAAKAKEYVRTNTGATGKILELIQMKRLLTN